MVQKLTQNRISLFFPLFTQSLCFGCLTYRTVSLFTVLSIKNVSFRAGSLAFINSSNRQRVGHTVFKPCYLSKVLWIYTATIPAYVVNNHTFFYISILDKVCNSMGSPVFLNKVKSTVSVFIKSILPTMTSANLLPKSVKSFNVLIDICIHIEHYIQNQIKKQIYA